MTKRINKDVAVERGEGVVDEDEDDGMEMIIKNVLWLEPLGSVVTFNCSLEDEMGDRESRGRWRWEKRLKETPWWKLKGKKLIH